MSTRDREPRSRNILQPGASPYTVCVPQTSEAVFFHRHQRKYGCSIKYVAVLILFAGHEGDDDIGHHDFVWGFARLIDTRRVLGVSRWLICAGGDGSPCLKLYSLLAGRTWRFATSLFWALRPPAGSVMHKPTMMSKCSASFACGQHVISCRAARSLNKSDTTVTAVFGPLGAPEMHA